MSADPRALAEQLIDKLIEDLSADILFRAPARITYVSEEKGLVVVPLTWDDLYSKPENSPR